MYIGANYYTKECMVTSDDADPVSIQSLCRVVPGLLAQTAAVGQLLRVGKQDVDQFANKSGGAAKAVLV